MFDFVISMPYILNYYISNYQVSSLMMFKLTSVTTYIKNVSYRQLRNNQHDQILINMSISLDCLYLTFLIGASTAPIPALCGISAALLQYFLLVFFGWTAVEAIFLYRNLVQVLVSQIAKFVLKAGLIVWSKHIVIY